MRISTKSTILMALEYAGPQVEIGCTVHGLLNQQTGYVYFTHVLVDGLETKVSSAHLTPLECEVYLSQLEDLYGSKALLGHV